MKILVSLIIGAAIGWLATFSLTDTNNVSVVIPTCAEDQVIVGTGSFEHGQWSAYVCGPALDDF